MVTQSRARTSRVRQCLCNTTQDVRRTGRAYDSRSKGLEFESLRPHVHGCAKPRLLAGQFVSALFMNSFHAAHPQYARSKEVPPHVRRTCEATIRPQRIIAPEHGSTGLEFPQKLECARPTAPCADGVQLALQQQCIKWPPRAPWSHSSAGQGVRPITVRSAVPARVGAMCLHELVFLFACQGGCA